MVPFSSFHAVAPGTSESFVVPENPYTSQDMLVYSSTVKFLPNTEVSACESNSNAADSPTFVVLVRLMEQILRSPDCTEQKNDAPSRC